MTGIKDKKSTRRAFFVNGGAVLGAGVAATAGAAALTPAQPKQGGAEDREAIRQLHLTFMSLVENQGSESAAGLFAEQGQLKLSGVTLHGAYRLSPSQQRDEVKLADDRLHATATFHVEVELCTPLLEDCTAAQMARLQGNVADRRWESGRFEGRYIKAQGQWKMASLRYLPS